MDVSGRLRLHAYRVINLEPPLPESERTEGFGGLRHRWGPIEVLDRWVQRYLDPPDGRKRLEDVLAELAGSGRTVWSSRRPT